MILFLANIDHLILPKDQQKNVELKFFSEKKTLQREFVNLIQKKNGRTHISASTDFWSRIKLNRAF